MGDIKKVIEAIEASGLDLGCTCPHHLEFISEVLTDAIAQGGYGDGYLAAFTQSEIDLKRSEASLQATTDALLDAVKDNRTMKSRADHAISQFYDVLSNLRTLHRVSYDSAHDQVWEVNPKCDECQTGWPCQTAELITKYETKEIP